MVGFKHETDKKLQFEIAYNCRNMNFVFDLHWFIHNVG